MNRNLRPCERVVRVVVGLAVASLAFWGPQSLWFLLGLIPVVSGLIGSCPIYTHLGIDTNKSCEISCCCKGKDKDKT
jgi:hypothetical protein